MAATGWRFCGELLLMTAFVTFIYTELTLAPTVKAFLWCNFLIICPVFKGEYTKPSFFLGCAAAGM